MDLGEVNRGHQGFIWTNFSKVKIVILRAISAYPAEIHSRWWVLNDAARITYPDPLSSQSMYPNVGLD